MVNESIVKHALNYEYLQNNEDMSRVISWLEGKKFFVLDTETTGLSPFTNDIVLVQVGNEDKQWIIDVRTVDISPLRPFLEDEKVVKLGQNIKHDLKFLMWKYKWWDIRNVADTMINEQVMRCGFYAGASMEVLCERYLRLQIDKDEELRKSFWHTDVGQFTERQLEYAAGDVLYPILIAKKQKPLIQQRGLVATINLEYKVIPVLAKMELNGMAIDKVAWNKLYQEAIVQKNLMEKKLNDFFGVSTYVQAELFTDDSIVRAIDYDSPHQVKAALAKLGYQLPNTNKITIALAAIEGKLPLDLAQTILLYRKYFTRVSRYGAEFLKAMEPSTGRIHSDFTQCLTTTGRLSSGEDEESDSDKVNLQNIPRESEYRSCFIPRPGYVFIVYDYQAIEPRILGELSHDPTYLFVFDNNKDLYGEVGTKILKEEVSKKPGRPSELRDKTKITVLGNSYGTGKEKFYKKMLVDMNMEKGILKKELKLIAREESDMMWEKFFEVCPKVRETLDNLSELANPERSERQVYDEVAAAETPEVVAARIQKNIDQFKSKYSKGDIVAKLTARRGHVTYSETIGGRKRYFKVYHRTYWTEGRNHPIQGTAADILKTAMVEIDNAIKKNKSDAFLVNQVHDEIIVEVRKEQAEEVDSYVRPILEQSEAKFLKRVPPKVEGGIKTKWEK